MEELQRCLMTTWVLLSCDVSIQNKTHEKIKCSPALCFLHDGHHSEIKEVVQELTSRNLILPKDDVTGTELRRRLQAFEEGKGTEVPSQYLLTPVTVTTGGGS